MLALGIGLGPGSLAFQSTTPCRIWAEPVKAGELDEAYIDEASGLDLSPGDPSRLYHINDSGDSGRFFVTALDGTGTQAVEIDGFDPVDAEDLAVGACGPDGGTCLFVADFGDNQARRATTEIVVVREQSRFPATVAPERRIRIRYPDGPHDAEALALHPNGDLIVLTKVADYARLRAAASVLYRLPYESWSSERPEVEVLERVGEIDLTAISSDPFSGSLPTAMDISDDGRRFLVLTYLNAFEFYLDLSGEALKPAEDMVEGVDYQEIRVTTLEQQESVAYLPSGDGFLYTTEARSSDGIPIMRVACFD